MEVKGKVHEVSATQQVTDSLKKRELILEYIENPQYPEYLKFEAIQDRCNLLDNIRVGDDVEVFFNLKGRPWTDKAAICLSAIPIALAANVTRITVTGILHKTVGSRLADLVFHDLAGWLMMPLALAILWAELRLLAWVLVPVATRRPLAVGFGGRLGGRVPSSGTPVPQKA